MEKKSDILRAGEKAAVQPTEKQKKEIENLQSGAKNLAASESVFAKKPKKEASQPGFFAKLWARIIDFFQGIFQAKTPENNTSVTPEKTQAEEEKIKTLKIKTLRREVESLRNLPAERQDVGPGLIQETPAKKPVPVLQKLFGTKPSKAKGSPATKEVKNLNELTGLETQSAQVENNVRIFYENVKAVRQQQERQAKGQGWQGSSFIKKISSCFAPSPAVNNTSKK